MCCVQLVTMAQVEYLIQCCMVQVDSPEPSYRRLIASSDGTVTTNFLMRAAGILIPGLSLHVIPTQHSVCNMLAIWV